ncbi:MAG: hypothetical protein JWR38_4064 [Mucilaginibacter sp.]|nr:hypothetical protein [Mucilaginibacter sp.]
MKMLYGKANKIGGGNVDLNESVVQNIISNADNNTIIHEFGHTLGLLHVNDTYQTDPQQYWTVKKQHTKDSTNAMFSGDSRYMHDKTSKTITRQQLDLIIQNYRFGKINLM